MTEPSMSRRSAIADAWDQFGRWWFEPAPPERLAILRIAVGVFCFAYGAARYQDLAPLASADPRLFLPQGPIAFFTPSPPSRGVLDAVFAATMLANLAFMIGFRFAVTGPLFAALYLLVASYRSSWSMIYHSENVIVWQLFAIGFSPAADALSMDARGVNRARRVRSPGRDPRASSWRYGWPVRLVSAVTAACYFVAGTAKVAGDLGWGWAEGDALRKQVAADAIRKAALGEVSGSEPFLPWESVQLFTLIGVMTLVLELGAPAAVLWRRVGFVWAVMVWSMHWGIYFVMGIKFRFQLTGLVVLAFIEPERALFAIRAWLRRRPPPTAEG